MAAVTLRSPPALQYLRASATGGSATCPPQVEPPLPQPTTHPANTRSQLPGAWRSLEGEEVVWRGAPGGRGGCLEGVMEG
eukprot:1187896-Prorocentrum_minimum.AAC.1